LLKSAGYDHIDGKELVEWKAQKDDEDAVYEGGLTVVVVALAVRPAIR
jgi:hypothetical protein